MGLCMTWISVCVFRFLVICMIGTRHDVAGLCDVVSWYSVVLKVLRISEEAAGVPVSLCSLYFFSYGLYVLYFLRHISKAGYVYTGPWPCPVPLAMICLFIFCHLLI